MSRDKHFDDSSLGRSNQGDLLVPTLATLVFVISMTTGCAEKKAESATTVAPEVEVVQVVPQNVPITKEWVAVLKGSVNADIRPQVSGYLLKQNYMNGSFVSKGDVLFQIDPRPFQAVVDQAKANLEQSKGAVQQANAGLEEAKANQQRAEAELGKTEIDVTRYTPLAKARAISQQELDNAVQANLAAKAQVEATKAAVVTAKANIDARSATVEASRAALQTAELNLGFTNVTSLISGVAGIANAQVGDLVSPQSSTPLTTISTVDPVLAQFSASEQEYLSAATRNGGSSTATDAALRALSFELILADGSVFGQRGRLEYVDRQVDERTGSINIQVSFPNPNQVLRPGGYGSVRTVVRTEEGALTVPQRAISELQGRQMVAVVHDGKVAIREVKMGEKVGSSWVVKDGLKAGDQVVAEGIQKVRDGMQVTATPYHDNVTNGNVSTARVAENR